MAVNRATVVGHPGAKTTDLPRPTRQNPSSRIPAKSTSSSSSSSAAKPKLGASPHIGPSYGQLGYSSSASTSRRTTNLNSRTSNGDTSMSLPQPALSIPTKPILHAPPSPQPFHTTSGSLTPSPSADTPPPPSLVSGSSASSYDSPRSNILRRKPSVIAKFVADKQNATQDSPFGRPLIQQIDGAHHNMDTPSAGCTAQIADESDNQAALVPKIATAITQEPVELRCGADGNNVSRQTPLSETATTPSIPHSVSPSQFSQSTAPTSLTSHSPMIGFSPYAGTRSFTSLPRKTSPHPNEPLTHPFFRQANDSGTVSSTSLQRPRTAPQASSPTIRARAETNETPRIRDPSRKKSEPVHPPELAHLNQTAQSSPEVNASAPPRPSRDGTPNLTEHKRPRPVVQSGLPKLNTFQHRRKPSDNGSLVSSAAHETPNSVSSPNTQRTPLSGQDTSPRKTISERNASQTSLQSQQLNNDIVMVSPESKTTQRASKQKSRFGFLSRKPKQEPAPSKDATKLVRKGPAAGTGHEGYGKHTLRARSGSSSSTGSNTAGRPAFAKRKSSEGSNSSKAPELDEFLQQRLSPVYLRGEGKDNESQGRASGSAFEAPLVFTPSVRSRETSHTSASSFEIPKAVADSHHPPETSSESGPVHEKPPSRGRDASEQSIEASVAFKSRSPSRKRLAKSRPVPKESALKHVEAQSPTAVEDTAPRPSTSSRLARVESHESHHEVKSKKSHWSLFPKAPKEPKATSTKWSFFHKSKPNASPETSSRDSMSAATTAPAHYLPADEPANVDVEDLENIMREAAERADDASSVMTNFEDTDEDIALQGGVVGQTPFSVPTHAKSVPTVVSHNVGPPPQVADPVVPQQTSAEKEVHDRSTSTGLTRKPSRLHPVGRIPPVTCRREPTEKLPVFNFSRPLVQTSPKPDAHSPPPSGTSATFPFHAHRPQDSTSSESTPHVPATAGTVSNSEADLPLKLKTGPSDLAPRPLFDFPQRKNSDISYSSSSVSGTMHFPTATTIAYEPGRNSRASKDETWPEFDDLIDHVLTPSPASSHHSRQYFEKRASAQRASDEVVPAHNGLPTLGTVETFPRPAGSDGRSPTKAAVTVDANNKSVGVIAAALRDPPSVSTMRSRRSNSLCNSYDSQESARSSLKHKRSNSSPQAAGTHTDEGKRRSRDEMVHENPFMFRYRVLMTSKWLSFGRLLFSPIHDELGNRDDRVLVIDGLGNRDWSYYCAVSYPHTQVYSLGPSAPSAHHGRTSLGHFGHLPNYRHFGYTTPGTDFPFPKGFFAAVVYRFPVADSDFVMRATISECKRVLRPGGYLEVSTIDLDLANMGPMTRRAVRRLKTDMHTVDPRISLKPASDYVQGLLGRRGFENLNRCIVGVPAAGVIASSRENSATDNNHHHNDMDFTHLAHDHSKESDDSITKMVAQVGRWWYTRCYETGVSPHDDPPRQSMWRDEQLLQECEALSTTFKLLICYAQKPSCVKRRTVSL